MKRFAVVLLGLALALAAVCAEPKPDFTRTKDVIYGRKFGMALTLDVFQPKSPNGFGIISVVSGGWISAHENVSPAAYYEFLRRGYTVFAVVHGSQPKFVIPEAIQDLHRAVRFIRYNAARYGIDPGRLGITGGSAGGHLSLIMGTQGGPGDPQAKDPVDRESSAVQCVACFFPPTDFLNYGKPGEDATGVGSLKDLKAAFGPRVDDPEDRKKLGREISPIYYITSNLPPTLIIHGNADTRVPVQQSEAFVAKARAASATAKLIVREGKRHGWIGWVDDEPVCAAWFDEYLRGLKPANAPSKDKP